MLWVGTSWKMNGLIAFARDYASRLATQPADRWNGVQPFVIPSSTALAAVRDQLGDGSAVMLGAQNAHWEESGAWTGELSVPQVADAGAQIVELGHSSPVRSRRPWTGFQIPRRYCWPMSRSGPSVTQGANQVQTTSQVH